jgi:hypothetical protein
LSIPRIFLNTVGDLTELPKFLKAAASFEKCPSREEMEEVVEKMDMQTLFN